MNWLFRRHFWVLHLVFLGIVAVIAAKTFTTLAGYWLSKSIPEKPSARLFEEPVETEQPKNFSLVNDRNLFAARREQISFADLEEADEVDPGRWQDAMPSSLPIKLVSTMVFLDPFDSRAVIMNAQGGASSVFSIGECEAYKKQYNPMQIETVLAESKWEPERHCNEIFGMAILKRIEEFRVYIFNTRDKRYEFLSLLPDDRRPIRMAEAKFEAVEGEGVRKVGATSYEIDQSEFDKALANVGRLMTEARVVPEKDQASGNFIGFKLMWVKEGSLFEKIGIKKDDVLTRINGYELNSPEKALQLFGKLKTAPQFTIDLKREEKSVTLDYSVVP